MGWTIRRGRRGAAPRDRTLPLVCLLLLLVASLASGTTAWAQGSTEVTVEVTGEPDPTPEPSPAPSPDTPAPPSEDPVDPAPDPLPDPEAPEEPRVEPPPRDPLPRTGADLLRLIRDALALLAAGIALVRAARRTEIRES